VREPTDLEDLADLVRIGNPETLGATTVEVQDAMASALDAGGDLPPVGGRVVHLPSGSAIATAVRVFRAAPGTIGLHLLAIDLPAASPAPRSEWLAWARAVLGPDWFYGGYLVPEHEATPVDDRPAGMAVYLNTVGWPVSPPSGQAECLQSVAHHLRAADVELFAA